MFNITASNKFLIGFKMLTGLYKRFNAPVPRGRLWDSIRRVKIIRRDPVRRTIRRRVYRVKAPLTLWHIDGHHKLGR